jgi:hypothetical protein
MGEHHMMRSVTCVLYARLHTCGTPINTAGSVYLHETTRDQLKGFSWKIV